MNLIDKDALVEYLNKLYERHSTQQSIDEGGVVINDIEYFLDTLEVKEVDFGTEVYKYMDEHFRVYDDGNQTLQNKDKHTLINMVDAENIAKHFFELGLKAMKG